MRPSLRWYAAALAGLACLALVWALADSLFPIFLGFALAYAFDPAADWLESRGLGRVWAVALIMGAVIGGAALAAALVLPGLLAETREFAEHFPAYLKQALDRAAALAARWGVALPHDPDQAMAGLRRWLEGVSMATLAPAGRFAARFFSSAAAMLVGALNLIIVPVVFFYFLRDISALRSSVLDLVPARLRAAADARLEEADLVFSGYIRGQLLVAVILATLYAAGLAALGIRFGVLIGIVSGLLNIVPYLGVASGLALSLVMAAVDFSGWGTFAGVLAVFGACQALEGFVITPRLVGDRVGLTTVETLIALIIGGEVGGLFGLMAAIPAAGCLKAYARDAAAAYRRSAFYRGAEE